MKSKVSFNKVRGLLAPDNEMDAALGKNINSNQPDVEVLAMALKRVPCSREAFEEMKTADKDWVHLQFCVVAVGAPGFSSAPYLSTKKKGEKDKDTQPLYETSSKGTVFFPFEKGRTGKDRGRRVSEVEGTVLTAILEPGVCLTKFLRDENDAFEPGRFFAPAPGQEATAEIAENSFVFLQVGVTNAEQAAAGRLLKIKRIMPVADTRVVSPFLSQMPQSAAEHEAVMVGSNEQYPSIAKLTITPSYKIYALRPDPTSYVAQAGEGAILASDNGGWALHVSARTLTRCTLAANAGRARKLLNIALAMDAVTVLVRSSVHEEAVHGQPVSEAVHLHVDTNRMLLCRSIHEYDTWPGTDSTRLQLVHQEREGVVYWTDPSRTIMLPSDQESQLLFELSLALKHQAEERAGQQPGLLSDGCVGDFYPVRVHTAPVGSLDELIANKNLVMSLQLRPSLRNHGGAGKRRREAVEADELDVEGDE